MHKKILTILFITAWLLAGCAGNLDEPTVQPEPTPVEVVPEQENVPIAFQMQMMNLVTTRSGSPTAVYGDSYDGSAYSFKQGYTSPTQLKNSESPDGFGVFAYFTGNSNFGTGSAAPTKNIERQLVMWNQKVTSTDGSTWTYSPLRYWPANAAKISFFAYAPYLADGSINAPTTFQTDGTDGYKYLNVEDFVAPSINYTWSHTDPVDLMWGTVKDDTYDVNGVLIKKKGDDYTDMRRPSDNTLHWNFKHVLARTKFYIANYLSTDKLLDQVEAIGFVGAKTAKCLINEEYAAGKNKKGWYVSFSDDTEGLFNKWLKIKDIDMRMMITKVKLSGFYGNRVIELMNDGDNAKWSSIGTKYSWTDGESVTHDDYELKPLNPHICADIPDDKITINAQNMLEPKDSYVLEEVLASLASFEIDYGENVYDVSANGDDYLNLSAALAAVPEGSRKIGMNVRFINREKDKYEQYSFKSANIADFLDTNYWGIVEEGTQEIPLNVALPDDDEDDYKHYLLLIPQDADFDNIANNIKVEVEYRIITHVIFEDKGGGNNQTFDWVGENEVDFEPSDATSDYPNELWVTTQEPSSMYGYIMKDLQSNKSYKIVIRLGKVMTILYEVTDWDDNYNIDIPPFE